MSGYFWMVFVYIVFIAIYTLCSISSEGENRLLNSNELGDFLAGTFAPLAFLFLYLGYKQNSEALKLQGEELKLSTAALQGQVKEMQESVAEQKVMTDLLKTELEEKHNSVLPVFVAHCGIDVQPASGGNHKFNLKLTLTNHSDNDVKHLVIDFGKTSLVAFDIFKKQTINVYQDALSPDEVEKYKAKEDFDRNIKVKFKTILGREFSSSFLFKCFFVDGSLQIMTRSQGTTIETSGH